MVSKIVKISDFKKRGIDDFVGGNGKKVDYMPLNAKYMFNFESTVAPWNVGRFG